MRIFVNDDRHVMAKHSAVYPTQEELTAVQNMVSHTERALKAVSDWINEQEKGNNDQPEPDTMETVAEEENKEGRYVTLFITCSYRGWQVSKKNFLLFWHANGHLQFTFIFLNSNFIKK